MRDIRSACFCRISQHLQVYSSTTEYQRASLLFLPTENYNLPFMGHEIPYPSSLLVTCHQSSRLYGVIMYVWENFNYLLWNQWSELKIIWQKWSQDHTDCLGMWFITITKTLKIYSGTGGQYSNSFGRSDHWMNFIKIDKTNLILLKTWPPEGVISFPNVPM